jgi:riboflavin kinase
LLKKIALKGTVFTGTGQGKKYASLPWVQKQITEKLGFNPYLGTLNLRLNKESAKNKNLLEKIQSIDICPEKGYYPGLLIKAIISNSECAILIPKMPNYPIDVLEIIASTNLRQQLKLKDGDEVIVIVPI